MHHVPIYGLDIETDTTIDGLDPDVSRIVAIAVSTGADELFEGPEDQILDAVDARLAELPPGVIATWNGAAFDLPFIADRAARLGVPVGLRLRPDPRMRRRHAPLIGHAHGYRAAWFDHAHVDAYRVYCDDVGPAFRISCSLKSIARFVGLRPVEVDRSRIHDLDREALHAYASSDARLTRVLTERRWSTASRRVDHFDDGPADAATAPVAARHLAPARGRAALGVAG